MGWIGVEPARNITRDLGQPLKERRQMTAVATLTGALSDCPVAWHAINWDAVHRQVRRLQARMVKAVQAKRWGKVQALQHLLPHSFSGKALAVKRVTTNDGSKTPGVDDMVWDTLAKKACAIEALRQCGYRALPLRRISIPQTDGTGRQRPLSTRAICLRNGDAPKRQGAIATLPECLDGARFLCQGVPHHIVDPWGLAAIVGRHSFDG